MAGLEFETSSVFGKAIDVAPGRTICWFANKNIDLDGNGNGITVTRIDWEIGDPRVGRLYFDEWGSVKAQDLGEAVAVLARQMGDVGRTRIEILLGHQDLNGLEAVRSAGFALEGVLQGRLEYEDDVLGEGLLFASSERTDNRPRIRAAVPPMPGQHYVVGFVMDEAAECVALIQKRRPAWQRGKWNGLGGKVEPGETERAAISREVLEEAGIDLPPESWDAVAALNADGVRVAFYFARTSLLESMTSRTDEIVDIYRLSELPSLDLVENVPFVIALALHGSNLAKPVEFWDRRVVA